MITYNYLQDNRTNDTYRKFIEAGVQNQRIAITQLIKDWEELGYKITAKWLDQNTTFQTALTGIEGYKPDLELTFITPYGNIKRRNYEVKVTDHEPGEFIDIKDYQVDQLDNKFKGSYLFYSTPSKYFSIPIHEIKRKCDKVVSQKIGGKICYRLWTPGLYDLWKRYSDYLNLVPYPKR